MKWKRTLCLVWQKKIKNQSGHNGFVFKKKPGAIIQIKCFITFSYFNDVSHIPIPPLCPLYIISSPFSLFLKDIPKTIINVREGSTDSFKDESLK